MNGDASAAKPGRAPAEPGGRAAARSAGRASEWSAGKAAADPAGRAPGKPAGPAAPAPRTEDADRFARRPASPAPPGPAGVDPNVFHAVYHGRAPWDIGRPQPEVVKLLEAHRFEGPVLDVGCGTGENAILLAMSGYDVTAIDLVPRAVEIARAEAEDRDVEVEWLVGDALELPRLVGERRFATVLDAGVFHVFSDADRPRYAAALREVTHPAGHLHVIVFSEHEGGKGGPRRVSRKELEAAFADGWHLDEMVEARYHIHGQEDGARAWRGTWRRRGVRT